jgi:enoyl-[acyl-carrier protein] reductase I
MSQTSPTAGLLQGRRGLIVGVANQHSIAWACAKSLAAAGMELAFTYQGETMRERVAKTTADLGGAPLFDLDVQDDGQIEAVFTELRERWGRLDFLLHAVAFAPKDAMANPFLQTSRRDFLVAHDVSAYSLVALARAAAPLMEEGGSIVTMSYYGAEKVVPGYNVMGVRYLAANLGRQGIRINAVSAGAVNTLAARGVSHFRDLLKITGDRSPMGRPIDVEEVGKATLFLASDLASGITGETIYVDAGFHITAG